MLTREQLHTQALDLLKQLIATPSVSREEDKTASILEEFFLRHKVSTKRRANNVWAVNKHFDPERKTILLNSHHDTVRPNPGYTRDPFQPSVEDGKVFGLGSNDAGGPLVSLIATFLHFYDKKDFKYNLVMAATAEEEISGTQGIESIWPELPDMDAAIVGEPTEMDVAVSEKGLLVVDCVASGKAGHAARDEGENAIYKAMEDIQWFRTFQFPKVSESLGHIKMSVTIIQAGQAHNQVPSECRFTVDIRVTDAYTLEEVLNIVREHTHCTIVPRSLRIRPSAISHDHPLVISATKLNKKLYGSPTTSDRALIPVPSIKMGPGSSSRSHMADEFIFIKEVTQGIDDYIQLIELA